ncbi:MAG: glycoside hydrolase family 16 protein [Polyangiaceae bacterium]
MAAPSKEGHQNVALYVTPKVSQEGKTAEKADDAKGFGRASATPRNADRKISVQVRKVGSQKWDTLLTEALGKDGGVDFVAQGGKEYRAKYHADGKHEAVYSEVQRADWKLAFDEEFDQKTREELAETWSLRTPEYDANSKSRKFSKGDWRAVDMHEGTVRLRAIEDPDNADHYLNGHITHGFHFISGWAAARVRFHGRAGSHSCFWLQNGYAPGHAEVDVAEFYGRLQANVYWDWDGDDVDDNLNKRWFLDESFDGLMPDKRYHVYTVHWEAGERYQFFVDGVRYATGTKGVATEPEFLILSMLTNDGERAKFKDDYDYKMEVDWVRVWQDKDAPPVSGSSAVSEWRLSNEFDGVSDAVFMYGEPDDVPIVGDWDGSGTSTSGVFVEGTWHLTDVFGGEPQRQVAFGLPGDVPVAGDWNGDGIETPGVFRDGTWYLSDDFSGATHHTLAFGLAGDQPVVGDWDGDGVTSVGVFRQGTWILSNTFAGSSDVTFAYGTAADRPVAGDWDGDGRASPGLFHAGAWSLSNTFDGVTNHSFELGGDGDTPLAGNWDALGGWGVGIHR